MPRMGQVPQLALRPLERIGRDLCKPISALIAFLDQACQDAANLAEAVADIGVFFRVNSKTSTASTRFGSHGPPGS